ncbi:hypothetical protein VHEMI02631 [[Torrubiella] hemipterigena]|nr:hypothetical protein VHEMI02631 [[Torrubiella] hemipterigena]
MVYFPGSEYRSHTSCITEDQKYQGALYKEKPNKKQNKQNEGEPSKKAKMSHQSYVEDAADVNDFVPWGHYEGQTEDERSPAEPMPEAPTPPPAVVEDMVNVFDYMIAKTPNASHAHLPQDPSGNDDTSLVRYDLDAKKYLDTSSTGDREPLVQYGTGPVPTDAFVTPHHKERRRNSDSKKDKKRKRLHVDVRGGDQDMTDAPPVLHSGLTGGLKNLLRPNMPPSPGYSSGDNDRSPASPLKKTKHSKSSKPTQVSNSIFDMIVGSKKSKSKDKKDKDKKKSRRHRAEKETKMIEYRAPSRDGKTDESNGQMIVFKPRADVFLGFVNKGPDSDRGCSMNKALRKYHKERQACGSTSSRGKEEKELWRSLRLRKNDRGEIVVFGL